jgi:hypothetical protein
MAVVPRATTSARRRALRAACAAAGLLTAIVAAACAPVSRAPARVTPGALHPGGASSRADPTLLGPHLVPEAIDEERTFGVEPGGGLRTIAAGVRAVSLPSGAVLVAPDRLPVAPAITTAMPERLGGGFLFVLGSTVWRADRWLSQARPIFASTAGIARVVVGLDRVYLRSPSGAHQGLDPRTGRPVDLGPWPGSSFVGAYAAADGWRAVAIDDLRGVVATFDAGATWRALDLPIDAHDVALSGEAIVVGGEAAGHVGAWYEVRADGQVGRLAAPPVFEPGTGTHDAHGQPAPFSLALEGTAVKSFGKRPLLAAVEDGWPLDDGTALVARDGALGRVRLEDGALVEIASDAYPLRPSRCHPVPLARAGDPAAFGFVCGEPRGTTALYAYDVRDGRMIEKKRFDRPRQVLSSGNGALVTRGACGPARDAGTGTAAAEDDAATHTYCTLARDDVWREVHVRGDIGGERVAVLADGRFVIVSPPQGDLAAARITVLEGGRAVSAPIQFPPLGADVVRVLKLGVWLDGMEERRPGVLGGWIEAGGAMLGVEVALDGHARVGDFVRDAGAPMVSGRYGLGWTASRRGYETLDGGMTWTPFDVPEPIAPPRMIASRACGPIGCSAAGWLRIGWGPLIEAPPEGPPPALRPASARVAPTLALRCDEVASQVAARAAAPPTDARARAPRLLPAPLPGGASPPSDLPAFYTLPGPALREGERGITYEASDITGRAAPLGPVARVYAWGPRSGDWERSSRWVVRWMWPFGGPGDLHGSSPAATPSLLVDVARFGTLGPSAMMPPAWSFAAGEDATHALLFARRSARADASVFTVEADRVPVEIRRADGDAFTEIDAAIQRDGRWYLATPAGPGELMSAVVWQVEGPVARELTRVPRGGVDARPPAARLAWRSDARVIGLLVDGQPSADRSGATRWVLPIDLETGREGEPELLGAADLGDRAAVTPCARDDAGWVMDVPASLPSSIVAGDQSLGALHGALVRARVTREAACIERMAGALDAYVAEKVTLPARPPARAGSERREDETSISVSVFAARARHAYRCVRR